MKMLNIHEAKTQFSRVLAAVERGEEVVIARAGKPVAKVVPFSGGKRSGKANDPIVRKPGGLKGRIQISGDFDAPLPDEMVNAFYDSDNS
jgi:prevent-host-death family protein